MGISFHDKADALEKILSEQPDIEFVRFNLTMPIMTIQALKVINVIRL